MKLKERFGLGYNSGTTVGAEAFLKYYDVYRRKSPFAFLIMLVIGIFINNLYLVLLSLVSVHFHIYLNQIWWQLKSVENGTRKSGSGETSSERL